MMLRFLLNVECRTVIDFGDPYMQVFSYYATGMTEWTLLYATIICTIVSQGIESEGYSQKNSWNK